MLQAKAGKFADAADRRPVFWLRSQAPRILPADVSLRQAGALAAVSVDLAVAFPRLRPLPAADTVPDPSSGVPTRPPGAFAVPALPMWHLSTPVRVPWPWQAPSVDCGVHPAMRGRRLCRGCLPRLECADDDTRMCSDARVQVEISEAR